MEALNALRILTAHHILSANMKNANVELVSSEMEERVSLVRRLIPINNLRNLIGREIVTFRIKLFMKLQIRVSQPLAKLGVALK